MTHRVHIKTIQMPNDAAVDIKYWSEGASVYVAGFDADDKQITAATYSASVEIADDFNSTFREPLIESLASTVESDLLTNPELHYKP